MSLLLPLAFIYLLLTHLFLPNLGGTLLHPREYFIWIVINFILLLAVFRVVREGEVRLPPGRIPFLVFILLSLSSALFNPLLNKETFLIGSVHLFAIYFIWIALNQFDMTKGLRDRVLALILASAVIEALIGLFQFLGWFRFLPVTPLEGEGFVWGAFQQKNLFGSFVATGLVISLYFASSPLVRGPVLLPLFLASSGLLGLGLVFSNSRTAWVGFILGSLILLVSRLRIYRSVKTVPVLWAVLVGLSIALGIEVYGGSEDFKRSLTKRESSNAQRILMLRTSWEMFKERPVTGHGFGNFESLYMRYQAKVLEREKEYSRFVGGFVSHPHNEVANVAVQSGLIGLFGLGVVVLSFLRMIWRLGREKGGLYVGLLSPLVFHTLVEYPLELSVVHYFTFILLLALVSSHLVEIRKVNLAPEVRKSVLIASLVLFLFASASILITFRDYMRMVLFAVELEKGKLRPELMEGAVKNPYLKSWAVPMLMLSRAKKAIEEKDTEFLKEFVLWADREKVRRPHPNVFIFGSLALAVLGEEYKDLSLMDESMKLVEEGLRIYPNDRRLADLKGVILAKSIPIVVDYLRRGRDEKR